MAGFWGMFICFEGNSVGLETLLWAPTPHMQNACCTVRKLRIVPLSLQSDAIAP